MSIVVTGASGEFGLLAATRLLELVPPEDVVLVSRSPERLEQFAARGAAVRFADFDRPDSLAEAFAGGEKLLLVSTVAVGENRRRQHRAAIAAAEKAGVRHIAYTSSVGIHPRNPSFIIPDHTDTEAALRDCGMETTVLRMASYADILAKAIAPHAIETGQWVSHSGDGCAGFVAKDDCARAAVGVLTNDRHAGAVYHITGPQLLSNRDAAALAAEMSGRAIAYVEPEESDEASKDQAETWIGPFTMADLLSTEHAVRQGFSAICTHDVEMITGRPARSLRRVYADNGIGA